ncbi:hypothetical protein CB0940_03607 [Cercospora beticola]|uniref:Uncharacterized protein n=1 Tax=Cercospora beticola TaxID=122368 RepID=A0A2G5I4Q9_CERBT|nr:hypothetical protein CB0940_03607 [Cercospora beticola]PIA99795.1 hypothetical protein CB0940_03607 [Cercospora beticola]WPB00787.1 hypothetical protein RHO25_005407 [Cercospora beticola]CAK1360976.1 unnamed protein product [Cercospora beticola]
MSSQSGASHRDDGLESPVPHPTTPSENRTSHFRLLDLPPELRLIINEFVLFSDFEECAPFSRGSLVHPLYYVSREMQAEVEPTYIKALDNYEDRVRDTVHVALKRMASTCQATVDHSEAMRQAEEAGNMTREDWRKGRVVSRELEAERREAMNEWLLLDKKGARRKLEIELQTTRINLARAREEEDEAEEAEVDEASDSD